ncbi:MAG: PCMD domain-containing protein, partial [Muribaculaceae bacterium]|nr:PCMD domain-containing protein [Muribaculaceae bacterium]
VVYIAADGGAYKPVAVTSDASRKIMHIKGLAPGTSYDIRIINDDQTIDEAPGISFVTEQAAPIPNGNLDAEVTVASSGAAWQNIVFDTWGTNNAMTTSQPTGSNSIGNNRPYKAISGTIQTTDSHSGNAALIRSVGWGSSNSATGSKGTSGTCKYTDPGLLHLGSVRSVRPVGYGEKDNVSNSCSTGPVDTDDLECGISFGSRPAAVSFWYKYSPKNPADKGLAEAWLKDASGNIIESATILLDATDTYTQMTLDFDFDEHTPQCASLYIKFLSSYDMDYVSRTDNNFSGPGFGGQNGTFMGSQLYIDDVELTY